MDAVIPALVGLMIFGLALAVYIGPRLIGP